MCVCRGVGCPVLALVAVELVGQRLGELGMGTDWGSVRGLATTTAVAMRRRGHQYWRGGGAGIHIGGTYARDRSGREVVCMLG